MGTPQDAIVQTQSLTKRFRSIVALNDCTLSILPGEVFGLLGPNGAGKTTLLRLLTGFLRPTEGRATIGGRDCYRQSLAVRRMTSYLPAEARLFRGQRGRDALAFFARVRGEGGAERGLELARRLDLDLSRRVAQMSTGMRQKLALAAVLLASTPLLILDEPTASLDPTIRSLVLELVAEAKAAGRTVLFSSHVLSEVEEVCDRVVILRAGQLAHMQRMSELRKQHRIRARFRGNPPEVPVELREHVTTHADDGAVLIETTGQLPRVLGWLATSDLEAIQVEPTGLRSVYERFHGRDS